MPHEIARAGTRVKVKGWNFEEWRCKEHHCWYCLHLPVPSNLAAEKIISRNFRILREDSKIRNIFNKPPLKAFRHAENLKDLLVRSSLPHKPATAITSYFPCNRTRCRTCLQVNLSSTITTPERLVNINGYFSCITKHVVYCLSCTKCPSTVYIGETGRRSADRLREHRRDVINERNDLPVPARFNQTNHAPEDMKIMVLKAGVTNQRDYRKKQEMRLIFKHGTMSPSGLNQDFSFKCRNDYLFCLLAREYAVRYVR